MSGHGFHNDFQIFNLNKSVIATATSRATFTRHAIVCNATIPSLCTFFPKSKDWRKNYDSQQP